MFRSLYSERSHQGVSAAAAVQVDLNADQCSLVIQLTAERAVTLAREHRLADEAQERYYEQLEAKDQALRASQTRAPDLDGAVSPAVSRRLVPPGQGSTPHTGGGRVRSLCC